MTRVLVLIVLAAAIVPTAALGRPATSASSPSAFHICPANEVVRAFRAEGTRLRVTNLFVYGTADTELAGRMPGGPRLDVEGYSERDGFVFYDDVSVLWTTQGSCRRDIRRVRRALEKLPRLPHAAPLSARCTKVTVPYP